MPDQHYAAIDKPLLDHAVPHAILQWASLRMRTTKMGMLWQRHPPWQRHASPAVASTRREHVMLKPSAWGSPSMLRTVRTLLDNAVHYTSLLYQ